MEDSKKIITPSSPNLIALGNNENESENHRNSQQKTKNFMAPTISASSKMTSPKKRILAEWKPPILDSKSELHKMGISNSNSRNSLSKNPLISSPKNNVENSDENLNDEETCVPDSCAKPYDPLTNYLSPRPKFLRYNPNRKRKLLIQRGNKLGSISPSGSLDCESSSSSQSSSKNEENEGIKQIDEQEIVEDDDEEDEEEIIEGRNWGLKWVFFKGLIVFFAWLFFTVFISSMNAPTNYPDSSISGSKVGYENFDNVTLRVVSLLNVDSMRWIDKFGVDKIETPAKIVASSEENQVSEEENLGFDLDSEGDYEEDTRTLDDVYNMKNMNADFYQLDSFKDEDEDIPMIVERQNESGEVEILDSGLKSEDGVKENVVPKVAPDHNVVNQEEKLVDFEEKINVVVPKSNDGDLAIEVEVVVEGSFNDIEQKNKGGYANETVDSVSEFKDAPSQNVAEVPFVEYDHNVVNQEEKMVDFEPRPNGSFENEVVVTAEGSSNDIEQMNKGDYDHEKVASVPEFKDVSSHNVVGVNFVENFKQLRLTGNDRILIGAVSLMIWVGILVIICWRKCKKAFTKTNTSRRRINPRVARSQNNRNVGLPLTVDERLDQESDCLVNTNLSSVLAGEGTSRRFPGVKQLGELEFTGGFSGSVKSTGLRGGKMQQEQSVFAVPDDRKAKKSKGSHTPPPPPPESPSFSSKISERMTTMQVDGIGEVSAVRRSERIRNRGITSP